MLQCIKLMCSTSWFAGVRQLAESVVKSVGREQKEAAILKLYAVLNQATWVAPHAEGWAAAFIGLLDLGLARFIKHAAGIVIRRDKGFSDAVRISPPIGPCLV